MVLISSRALHQTNYQKCRCFRTRSQYNSALQSTFQSRASCNTDLTDVRFIIYNLRTSYLSHITDGVGERLITVNQGVFNTPGFRAAGWQPSSAEIKRTYSPPIPTAIASEYFQAPPRSAGLPLAGFGDDEEEGGMVTGAGGSGDTVGPALNTRRRRRKEQMEEEDSSDLSDESDEDGEGMHR